MLGQPRLHRMMGNVDAGDPEQKNRPLDDDPDLSSGDAQHLDLPFDLLVSGNGFLHGFGG